MIRVLGLDPGFASTGWALAELRDRPVIVEAGVIRTAKSPKRTKVLAADDNFRRCRELAEALAPLLDQVSMVCAEAMSPMRNASSAAKVALCWGVIAGLCQERGLPLAQVSPQGLKKALCGRVSVTDAELHPEMERRFPELVGALDVPRGQREHAYDAAGAIEACRGSEVFRALESVRRVD